MVAPMVIEGAMTAEMFLAYVENYMPLTPSNMATSRVLPEQ
jgi:hypothetical protein